MLEGGATQSLEPANIRAGAVIPAAAAMAEGLVSAAARLASAVIAGSCAAARTLAPPPIEWPVTAQVVATAP